MDTTPSGGSFAPPSEYDYRLYDKIWRRVSPDLDPYPEVRAAGAEASAPRSPALEAAPAPRMESAPAAPGTGSGGLDQLPGADMDPCCMGSQAQQSIGVLEGFLQEELAQRQCVLALIRCVREARAARLLRSLAEGKLDAARRLKAARYLISADCSAVSVMVEPACWKNLPQALRAIYHQEACNGFNYQRAADEATDLCLQKLLADLGREAYRRSEAVLELLGKLL